MVSRQSLGQTEVLTSLGAVFCALVTSNRHPVVDKGELECHAVAVLLRRHYVFLLALYIKGIQSLIDVYFKYFNTLLGRLRDACPLALGSISP